MAFQDYSLTPASNTSLADGTFVGPNMLRNKVRPAIQQLMADGKGIANDIVTVNAAIAAIPAGPTGPAGDVARAADRAALAGIAGATAGLTRALTESGREGLHVFDSSDLSAKVAADTSQGIYIAPASAPTGASGAWVRRFNGRLNIKWFGGKADSTALVGTLFNGTDNTAALNSAKAVLALQRGGGSIYFPAGPGAYRFASRQVHTSGITIEGDGWHQAAGQVGAVTYVGVQRYPGTVFAFDSDVGGMLFYALTDNNADALALEYNSSIDSNIRNVMFYSAGGTGIAAHGIETRTILNMDNVRIENFAGCGLRIEAYGAGANPYGSSDGGTYRRVSCRFNRLHGLFIIGDDANVNHFDTLDCSLNGGFGFMSTAGLGNLFSVPHAAHNNQSHSLNVYAANHSVAQRNKVIADWAGLSDRNLGSYLMTGPIAENLLLAPYAELGEGEYAHMLAPTQMKGGNTLLSATSTVAVEKSGNYTRGAVSGFNDLGAVTVKTGLGRDPSGTQRTAFWYGSSDDDPTFDSFRLIKNFAWTGIWSWSYANSVQQMEQVTGHHVATNGLTNKYAIGFPNGIYMGTAESAPRMCPAQAAQPATGTYRTGDWVPNSTPTIASGKVLLKWVRLTSGSAHVAGTDWTPIYGTTT